MMQSKQEIRAVIAAAEAEWPETYFQASDAEIARRVLAIPEWEAARTLFLYVSVRREPDTRALIEAALRDGKRVAVPRCLRRGAMEAREIHALTRAITETWTNRTVGKSSTKRQTKERCPASPNQQRSDP